MTRNVSVLLRRFIAVDLWRALSATPRASNSEYCSSSRRMGPMALAGNRVYNILVKDGYNVSIVQEPETSFKDDLVTTKRALALQDGPCILVDHS